MILSHFDHINGSITLTMITLSGLNLVLWAPLNGVTLNEIIRLIRSNFEQVPTASQ
jgi:hypothetical protein